MGSCYYTDPPLNPNLVPYCPPPTEFSCSSPNEFRNPFVSSFSPALNWTFGEPPLNPNPVPYCPPPTEFSCSSPNEFLSPFVSSFSSADIWTFGDPPINTSKVPYFPPPPDYFSSSPNEFRYLASSYPPIRDALIVNMPCEGGCNEHCADADGNKPTDDTLYGKTVSDDCGDSNEKLTTVESMGTAGSHNWNSKEKSNECKAAWNTSGEKDTGVGAAAAEYHTCEELSGGGSCGNACCTCAEADRFARKCTLGADCRWSGLHSDGNSTNQFFA